MEHIYTADEVSELTILAEKVKATDVEWRTLMDEVAKFIESRIGVMYFGWQIYHEELVALCDFEFRLPDLRRLPRVGQYTNRKPERAADWNKAIRKVQRDIDKCRSMMEKINAEEIKA